MENAEISEPLLRRKVDLVQHCRLSPLVFSLVLSSAESKVGRITASEEAPSLPGRGWEDSGRDRSNVCSGSSSGLGFQPRMGTSLSVLSLCGRGSYYGREEVGQGCVQVPGVGPGPPAPAG